MALKEERKAEMDIRLGASRVSEWIRSPCPLGSASLGACPSEALLASDTHGCHRDREASLWGWLPEASERRGDSTAWVTMESVFALEEESAAPKVKSGRNYS